MDDDVGVLGGETERRADEARGGELRGLAPDTLRGLVERSLTGIYVIQGDRFVYVNERFAEIFGFASPAEIVALPDGVQALTHPDDRAMVVDRLRLRLEKRVRTVHYTFRGLRRDGATIEVEVYGSAVEHEGYAAVAGSLLDVTEGRRAHRALTESEARFRALVEGTSDLVAIVDEGAVIRYASPSCAPVLGLPGDALRGRSILEHVHPDDRALFGRALGESVSAAASPGAHHVRFRDAEGSERTVELTLRDRRAEPGVRGVVLAGRDVTEQLALAERLRHAQRMEAVGQLAGGVAHDFNNVLAAVSGYAQMLRRAMDADDPRYKDVEEIVKAASRGATITRQLLAFARRQTVETEVLDLVTVVHDMGRMLRSLLPASIALDLPPADASPLLVRASRTQLEQIVVNLALNARDAMPRGGTLAFTLRRGVGDDRRAVAFLAVSDTGVGIPASVRDRVFDPFFTTKPPGQGTGLGLATVYGLVGHFGGEIALESEEGKGTTFTITFPLTVTGRVTPPEGRPAPLPEPPEGAPRRILVVEDEEQVRAITRRILAAGGYEVVEARDGAEAMAMIERGEAVDLVLSDVAMPVMDGRDLVARLTTVRPALPVVLMSGYVRAEPGDEAGSGGMTPPAGAAAFVEKPFTARHLLEVVGAVVGAVSRG